MKLYDINTINELNNSINIGLVKLEEYIFPKTYSFAVGKIYIKTYNTDVITVIDENISSLYVNDWHHSIGRLFVKDLHTNNLDNYFTICYNNIYYLFKLLTSDDKSYCKKKTITDFDEIIINDDLYALVCVSYSKDFTTIDFVADFKYDNNTLDNDEITTEVETNITEYDSLELFDDSAFNDNWDM